MDNWDVFLIVGEIIAFAALILSFSSKLNQSIGEFHAVILELKETVKDMQQNSRKTHKDLYDKLDDHETRISHLEGDKGDK